jgi:3',5'-cyclic AMP phosphodiesterase CpdA
MVLREFSSRSWSRGLRHARVLYPCCKMARPLKIQQIHHTEAMKPLFTWIHLSDIHFGHGDAEYGCDQQLVLQALRDDLVEQSRRHRPSAIFVTGDIAFSGKPEQYERALAWLSSVGLAIGLESKSIFVVPGNHDVNREVDRTKEIKRLIHLVRNGQESLDAALADPTDRDRFAKRMAPYLEFAARLAPACLERPSAAPMSRLFWCHRTTHGHLSLRFIGLNTALLAADNNDHSHLRLGKSQYTAALIEPPVVPGEIVIVLSHHPLTGGWLADEQDAEGWLRKHAHVHLSGHVHEPKSEELWAGAGGQFVRVVAGAAHNEKGHVSVPSGHGYNIAVIMADPTGSVHLHVWPRRWSANHHGFVVDVDNVPDGHEHAQHALKVRLPAESSNGPGGQRRTSVRRDLSLESHPQQNHQTVQAPGAAYHPSWYIAREDTERECLSYLCQQGKPTVLWGPQMFGKTWCLSHVVHAFQESHDGEATVIRVDMRSLPWSTIENLDGLLRMLADRVGRQCNLSSAVIRDVWTSPDDSMGKLSALFEDQVLVGTKGPTLLALDGADAVWGKRFQDDFFALLRGWCEDGAGHGISGFNPWHSFRLLLTVSTRPVLLTSDLRFSVFAGLTEPVRLEAFTLKQVWSICKLYQLHVTEQEIDTLYQLAGGHPYLVRLAIHRAVMDRCTLATVLEHSAGIRSPFRLHLDEIRRRLRAVPELHVALQEVARESVSPEHRSLYERLASAGLAVESETDHFRLRCPLYRQLVD